MAFNGHLETSVRHTVNFPANVSPEAGKIFYMKRTRKATPEIAAKAKGFIANGYQRLLTCAREPDPDCLWTPGVQRHVEGP